MTRNSTEKRRGGVTPFCLWILAFIVFLPNPFSTSKLLAAIDDEKTEKIRILAWNLESGGSDGNVIAKQIKEMGPYDIYAFSEVLPEDFPKISKVLGKNYYIRISKSGYDDRLVLAYNIKKFKLIEYAEMGRYKQWTLNPGNYRSPLAFRLRHTKTKQNLIVMNNHLARGKKEVRQRQARGLSAWAADQKEPILAVGDYNFDYTFRTKKGNRAFDLFLKDKKWKWIQPEKLIDTNWFDREGDGTDDYPGSMLDFAFTAGPAMKWKSICKVIVRKGDFPDDKSTSDHRPVELSVEIPYKKKGRKR